MLCEDCLGISIILHLPNTLHTGSLKAQIEASDAGEKAPEPHLPPPAVGFPIIFPNPSLRPVFGVDTASPIPIIGGR